MILDITFTLRTLENIQNIQIPSNIRRYAFEYITQGRKPIEDKSHLLISCPLYFSIREKFKFYPGNAENLAGLLSNRTKDSTKIASMARAIHAILQTNENFTSYYKFLISILLEANVSFYNDYKICVKNCN